MRLPDEQEAPFQINVVPLIDVLFALLTFFMIATLFLSRTEGLPVNLPKATTAKSQSSSQITITIDDKGQLALNRQPVQLNNLESQIKALMQINQQTVVIINADERVNHGQVIAVMDKVRKIEGAKLAIATQKLK